MTALIHCFDMRRSVRVLLIVCGCFLAAAGGCETDDEGNIIEYDSEGHRLDVDGNRVNPDGSPIDDDGDDDDGGEDDGGDDDVAPEVDAEDDPFIDPGAIEICDGPIDDVCEWEPVQVDGVWGTHGELDPANDWQTDPSTAHRGENPNPPIPYFIVDLPDGVVDAPGDWALFGAQAEGLALEGFTEGLDPRDPGCAPATPIEAGAFLTDPNRRTVAVIDGWSTCVYETTPGGTGFAYAYQGNEGGLFDYFQPVTFGGGPADWTISVEPRSVFANAPDGTRFPIVGDFDGDGFDDLLWHTLPED